MATITDYRGIEGPAVNLVTEGSRANMAYARATLLAADDTAGTFNVRFPQLSRILGFWVTIISVTNSNVVGHALTATDTTSLDVTIGTTVATLNRLTIADGSTYVLTAGDVIHILVVGIPK